MKNQSLEFKKQKRRFFNLNETESAFSLVEVLLALLIFGVGLLGVVGLQTVALMNTDFNGKMTVARYLATDQVERLGSQPFADSALDICGFTAWCYKDSGLGVAGSQSNINNMGQASGTGSFRREWGITLVEEPPGTPNVNIKKIDVRVFWSDAPVDSSSRAAHAFSRKIELSTIVVNPE